MQDTASRSQTKAPIDTLIYVAVFLGPAMNVPQLLKVWIERNATGVSALSWFGFAFISFFWLAYGVVHKQWPIIIMNVLLILLQSAVGIGALIYG
jgi:uncharacterized protein with PQ loop repeat